MKKTISILLTLSLAVGMLAVPASAATDSEMITAVQTLGIMIGDENGDMNLNNQVTRAQFTTMAVRTAVDDDILNPVAVGPFPDVPATHWSAPYVDYSARNGMVNGYLDGDFRPDNQISLVEGLNVVLKMLGYTAENMVGSYPQAQMTLADELGLLEKVESNNPYTILTRQQSAWIFYNALTATTAGGQTYAVTLGYSLDASGNVDLTTLVNATMEGPVVATGLWKSEIDMNLDSATIVMDGDVIDVDEIDEHDVLYWNIGMNKVWVYSDTVKGTIRTINPTAMAPTSIVLGGKTYQISTSAAAFALSDMGEFSEGDVVTLLLGRDGTVVGVF